MNTLEFSSANVWFRLSLNEHCTYTMILPVKLWLIKLLCGSKMPRTFLLHTFI